MKVGSDVAVGSADGWLEAVAVGELVGPFVGLADTEGLKLGTSLGEARVEKHM